MARMNRQACPTTGQPRKTCGLNDDRWRQSQTRNRDLLMRVRERVEDSERPHAPLPFFEYKIRTAKVMSAAFPVSSRLHQKRHRGRALFSGDGFRLKVPNGHFGDVPLPHNSFEMLPRPFSRYAVIIEVS